jgi:predicted O-methyltransferase YrrM
LTKEQLPASRWLDWRYEVYPMMVGSPRRMLGVPQRRKGSMRRFLKTISKKLLPKIFRAGLPFGIVILPNHYYTPVADVLALRRTKESWARRSSMTGVDIDIEQQAKRLIDMVGPFEREYRGNRAFKEAVEKRFGPGFGYIEAQCLHGVLRSLKPKRILEVGSGVSTHCMLQAVALNPAEGRLAKITCVEPHPSEYLRSSPEVELVGRKVQELDPSEFDRLESGDFLFIDSTHAVKPGGDVPYLYLEVLPRLKPGVVIHIHDITFPYLYQRDVLFGLFQWMETALLQALLVNNPRLSILFSLSMLHYDCQDALKDVFPEYCPASDSNGLVEQDGEGHFPSSTYLLTS